MRRNVRRGVVVGAAAVLAGSVSGCASAVDTSASAVASASAAASQLAAPATLIDVRTPQEYAAGHLEGAVNIDVSAPTFAATIAGLNPSGTYVVYCRSGNRSAAAAEQMRQAGFASVTDAGSVEEASQTTGVPVVR